MCRPRDMARPRPAHLASGPFRSGRQHRVPPHLPKGDYWSLVRWRTVRHAVAWIRFSINFRGVWGNAG